MTTNVQLHRLILERSRDAITHYLRHGVAGQERVPEKFVQNYCAARLMDDGYRVCVEVDGRLLKASHLLDDAMLPLKDGSGMFADMMVFDGDGEAALRAVVEFKSYPAKVGEDFWRTRELVRLLRTHSRHARDANAFGCIVAGGEVLEAGYNLDDQRVTLKHTIEGRCPDARFEIEQLPVRLSAFGVEFLSDVQSVIIEEAQQPVAT